MHACAKSPNVKCCDRRKTKRKCSVRWSKFYSGDELTRQYVLRDCRGLQLEWKILCRIVLEEKLNDLRWLVRFVEYPVSEVLSMVQKRFAAAGDMEH